MATPSLHGSLKLSNKARAPVRSPGRPSAKDAVPSKTGTIRAASGSADVAAAAALAVRQPFIHEEVGYITEGMATLTAPQKAVVMYIKTAFRVPDDFDVDKVRYGQLSGLTFEQRLMAAYYSGLLEPIGKVERMCGDCGATGHFPADCPAVFK